MHDKKMRFLVYGESWRGAMPYSAINALRHIGHEVYSFDYTDYQFRRFFPSRFGSLLDKILFRQSAWVINKALQTQLRQGRFDALLVFKGSHVWPETVQMAQSHCRWRINWNWDDYFNPIHYSPYLSQTFVNYDLIITSRRHLSEEYITRGARRVEHLHFCYDPTILYPVSLPEADRVHWGGDVVFVGSWSQRREKILSNLDDFQLKIWGPSWRHADRLFRDNANLHVMGRAAELEDMSRAFNASRISLNILTLENRDQTNVRNFEIPACGAFQLTERTEALQELFQEDKEIVCYASTDELIDKCRYFYSHDKERQDIARAGHQRLIASGHTYVDRMQQLVSLLVE